MLLTFLASFSGESPGAVALAVDAPPVTTAVGDLALVVAQLAFDPLPAGVAATLAILVVAIAGAQHGADAWEESRQVRSGAGA